MASTYSTLLFYPSEMNTMGQMYKQEVCTGEHLNIIFATSIDQISPQPQTDI